MNYLKIYNSIIENAKSQNRIKHSGVYYENHHILPKSLGGKNNKENLILLTAKEHYLCHRLLLFIYNFNESMVRAFHRMVHSKNGDLIKSAKDYQYARELLSQILKERIPWNKGKHLSPSHIQNLKGKGKPHTKETKQKLRDAKIGDKNPMFGKISPNRGKSYSFTEQQRENLRKSMKGKSPKVNSIKKECEYCHKLFTLPCYSHWHGDKCKNKTLKYEIA